MDEQKKANIIGKFFYVIFLSWVFGVEDTTIYVYLKSSEKYDKLTNKMDKENKIYEDTTYPIWRRALGKARATVINKRIPDSFKCPNNQKKLTEFGG